MQFRPAGGRAGLPMTRFSRWSGPLCNVTVLQGDWAVLAVRQCSGAQEEVEWQVDAAEYSNS